MLKKPSGQQSKEYLQNREYMKNLCDKINGTQCLWTPSRICTSNKENYHEILRNKDFLLLSSKTTLIKVDKIPSEAVTCKEATLSSDTQTPTS